jgi:charged multivesicular body protein 4A/B
MTLEREIYSIEAANINKETLDAMKNASAAMKQIHGGLTIDKVDATMEDLREQHAIGEEIGEAITQSVGGTGVDESELEDELEQLQQEELDNKMLETGRVEVDRLPSAPEGGKLAPRRRNVEWVLTISSIVKGKTPAKPVEEDEEEELRKLQAEMAM